MSPFSGGPRTPTPDQEQQFSDRVRDAFCHLPRFVARKFGDRVSSAWRLKGYGAACIKFNEISRTDLPVVNNTNASFSLNPDDLPGYLFGGLASDDAYGAVRAMSYRFNSLPDGDDGDIQMLAHDIAAHLSAEMEHLSILLAGEDACAAAGTIYAMAAGIAEHFRMDPPEWKRFIARRLTLQQLVVAISQMMGVRYWLRNLRHHVRRWRESLHIAMGDVRRQRTPYCSKEWVQQWMASRKNGRQLMADTTLEDEETGETLNLLQLVDRSISDTSARRAELITRVNGLEQIAKFDGVAQEQGYRGLFFTWTAPGAHHSWVATGYRNRKWNGANPRDTQRYFTKVWKQLSSAMRRKGINVFGLRVAEPHHDGTPHWHGILFVHHEQADALVRLFRKYADRNDAENLTRFRASGRDTHLEIIPIEEKKGSATAYITKHIGRNIDGCAPGGIDPESGHPWEALARNASAWACLWGIKQFQFIGSTPVSVWRELRRFNNQAQADSISPEFAAMHSAADAGDWATYTRLQGGPLAHRKSLTMRAWYRRSDEPDECGCYSSTIKGVYLTGRDLPPVVTRSRKWAIKTSTRLGAAKVNRTPALTPWTRVNNCIMSKKQPTDHPPDPVMKIPIQLKLDFGEGENSGKNEQPGN